MPRELIIPAVALVICALGLLALWWMEHTKPVLVRRENEQD